MLPSAAAAYNRLVDDLHFAKQFWYFQLHVSTKYWKEDGYAVIVFEHINLPTTFIQIPLGQHSNTQEILWKFRFRKH